ncbi:c-type cytochrome domain-containing protein [Catalinimonas niigatensis]|uniref:c-type cytochrome domain-containing protein n=1 Tax=Catalinimonas niigatensis TaxID=1397264 RepID=UPI002665C497|nr:c-type cytochrome domain-containing protein [Catalinimonas niigatensis]WPP50810.1 c-type cytochrome domain-containing protein [Catalinimonas niigatensis]
MPRKGNMQKKFIDKWSTTSYFKSTLVIVILISVFLLSLPLWPLNGEEVSPWVLFGGRFHPLIIHFPIVLLFLLLLLEILIRLRWIERQLPFQSLLLLLSVIFSVLSVLIGFALYQSGSYGGDTLELHLYSGIGVALGSLVGLMIFWKAHQSKSALLSNAYFSVLLLTNILLVFASHQGGSLTHGQDFLSEHFPLKPEPESLLSQKPMEEMLVFEDIIQSTLDARCYSCHNENKTKGDYLMTSFDRFMKGGKSEKTAVIPGDASKSELFHRITLPEVHDDRMPPEGKTSLTHQEIQILEKWIEKGALTGITLTDIQEDSVFLALLSDKAQQLRQERLVQERKNMELDGLIQLVAHQEQTFVLEKDNESKTGLALSMQFPTSHFDDNQLAELQAVFPHIHRASFNASNISDDAFYHIGQMKGLKALFLQHTRIKGSGLVYLQNLESLEILDLSGSEVDDAGLLNVIRINGLRHLYLYEAPVSMTVVDALMKNNPELEVHLERGALF